MARRMSCSMTVDAVRDRSKTVTRRHVDSWKGLAAGDRLTLVEKGMGLAKGEKQVVLAEVEVMDVRVETLQSVTPAEVRREGLWDRARRITEWWISEGFYLVDDGTAEVEWFQVFWLEGHGYKASVADATTVECRRIEWRYLDEAVSS